MALTITGLTKNCYLSNNPIYVGIEETLPFDYIEVGVGNFNNVVVTPLGNKATIDISTYVKASFPNLDKGSNIISLELRIRTLRRVGNSLNIVSIITINKSYIFGGYRGVRNNTSLPIGKYLITSLNGKIPIWNGFQSTVDILEGTSLNPRINRFFIDSRWSDSELKKVKGCNPTFVMFLNSLGGYSYWLFEGITDLQKNNNLGLVNNSKKVDLGNEYQQEIELYSKVSRNYMPLIQDLIVSPEIYIYTVTDEGILWQRHFSDSNSLEYIPAKSSQGVKIKLKPFNTFKPSPVWQ